MRKCLKWETRLSKEVSYNLNVSQTGSGGRAPSRWAIFRNFLEKTAILKPLDHISDFSIGGQANAKR